MAGFITFVLQAALRVFKSVLDQLFDSGGENLDAMFVKILHIYAEVLTQAEQNMQGLKVAVCVDERGHVIYFQLLKEHREVGDVLDYLHKVFVRWDDIYFW